MRPLLTIFFLFITFSINSFSQKVTYKDIIGTYWEVKNRQDLDPNLPMEFVDSVHFVHWGDTLNYNLDNSNAITLLHIYGLRRNGFKTDYKIMMKIFGSDTLKIQWRINDEIKWDDSTDYKGSLFTPTYIKWKPKYKIQISEWGLMFKGRTTWHITQDSILIESLNIDGSIDNYSKSLTSEDQKSIFDLLMQMNFKKIPKDTTANSAPDDMGEYDFYISFNKQIKTFHIYQVKIESVFNLVHRINEIIPEKYKIGYNDTYFRFQ